MINQLKTRELTQEAKDIIFKYIMGNITWNVAHNELLKFGIRLTENDVLIDY